MKVKIDQIHLNLLDYVDKRKNKGKDDTNISIDKIERNSV